MGPKAARSTSLTPLKEAAAVTFRQKTLLPLDDCLHALQREISSLTRSSLHRLYQHHGISQRPKVDEPMREKKSFKPYPIGYLHIDISEIRTGESKACLFVAVDRTSKFVYAQLYEKMTRQVAAGFLEATVRAFHYASLGQLQSHLKDYLWAYNSARPLRALKGKTPNGLILKQ